jgi:hypothetical protein
MNPRKNPRASSALATLLLSLLALPACVGYATWPPVNGSENATFTQINYVPAPEIIAEAVLRVSLRYTPAAEMDRGEVYQGPIAVSLPPGASAATYRLITSRVGPNFEPATEANAELPTYYVTRVNIRSTVAEIDVLAPAPRFGATGQDRYQLVSVNLAGGTQPWRVMSHRAYPVGMFPLPARNTIPAEIDPLTTLR